MANWPTLSPLEQQQILEGITVEVISTLPSDWESLILRGSAIGLHAETRSGIKMRDGSVIHWQTPDSVWRSFQQLRKGMYTEGVGSWVEFEYSLEFPGRYSISYNRDLRPDFANEPNVEDFMQEQRWFHRSAEAMPEWFRIELDQSNE